MNLDVLEAQTYDLTKRRALEGHFQRIFQRINSTFQENSAFLENFEFLEKFYTLSNEWKIAQTRQFI